MNRTAQGVLLGGGFALVLIAALIAVLVSGTVRLPDLESEPPSKLLVLATAPAEEGLLAQFAVVLPRDGSDVEPLDVGQRVVVSGTSAETPRDAYPFVGGSGVSQALSAQTDGETLDWVVLPPAEWSAMVDDAGGLRVQLPLTMSAYVGGSLVMFEQGERELSGAETVALVTALPYVEDAGDRDGIEGQLSAGMGSILASNAGSLRDLVSEGRADSSLKPDALGSFAAD